MCIINNNDKFTACVQLPPADAKEVAANPPTDSFLGFALQFSSRPDERDDLENCHSLDHYGTSEQGSDSPHTDGSALEKFSSVESLLVLPVLTTPHPVKPRSMSYPSTDVLNLTDSPLLSPPIGM